MSEQIVFGIRIDGLDGTIRNQQQLTDAIKQTKKELSGKDIDSSEYKKLQKTLGTLTAAQKNFRKETRDQAREAQAGAKGTEGAYRRLSAQLAISRERMKDLAAAGKKNTQEFKNLSREVTTLDGRLKRIDARAGQFQRSVGNYRSAFTQLGGLGRGAAMAGLGPMAGLIAGPAAAGMAITTALAVGSKQILTFEQSLADLKAVTNATDGQMQEFEDTARRLGGSTAFTAEQVLGLQTELSKLGFPVSEVNKMAESVVKLSTALDADASEAAELVGGQLRSFKADAIESARFTDVMASAASNSALDFRKLQVMLPTVSTVANQMNETFEETVSKLGTLANANLDASTAATGLRNVYLLNAQEGRTYQEGLDKITGSTDRVATATEMYGTRSAVVALILAEMQEETARLEETLKNAEGELERMNKAKLDTVAGQVKILRSAFSELILTIDNATGGLGKFIKFAVTSGTDLVKAATQYFKYGAILGERFEKDVEGLDKVAERQIAKYTKMIQSGKMTSEEFIKMIDAEIEAKERSFKRDREMSDEQRALTQKARENLERIKRAVLESISTDAGISDELKSLIADLNKEIEELGGGTDELNKEIEKISEGSLKAFQIELSNLKKELDNTKIGTEEWTELSKQIGEAEENLRLFQQRVKDIQSGVLGQGTTSQLPTLGLTGAIDGGNNIDLTNLIQRSIDAANAVDEHKEFLKEKEKQRLEELALFSIELSTEISNATFAIAQNNLQRQFDYEMRELDRQTKERLSKVESGSAEEAAILEDQKQKEAEIEQEARKKQQRLDVQQAILNGALAITKTFANLGFPEGLLGAAFVAAQTAAQVAVIRSQGFAEGGFTGHGGKYDPAGTVHKGEVVWNQRDVAAVGGASVADRMRPTYKGYFDGGVVGSFTGGGNAGVITDREIQAFEAAAERGTRKGTAEGQKEAAKEKSRLDRLKTNISV